jgi:hypothetical protein
MSGWGLVVFFPLIQGAAWASEPSRFSIFLKRSSGEPVLLKSWTLSELRALKQVSSSERDPDSGQSVLWKGPLVSTLIDGAIEKLSVEERAALDLISVQGSAGAGSAEAFFPRAYAQRYTVRLAILGTGAEATTRLVFPWTSQSQILKESAPLAQLFVKKPTALILENMKQRFSPWYLARRSDPAALRGERTFLQNCILCHGGDQARFLRPEVSARILSEPHPQVTPKVQVSDAREKRAIASYLDLLRK